jgi:hypothetical protein
VSGALAGNPPPPAAPQPAADEQRAATVDEPRTEPHEAAAAQRATPAPGEDQPTQAMPAVTSGDPLAPREHPGS